MRVSSTAESGEAKNANCKKCISLSLLFKGTILNSVYPREPGLTDACRGGMTCLDTAATALLFSPALFICRRPARRLRLLNTRGAHLAVSYRIDSRERVVYLTVTGESSFQEWEGAMRRVLDDPAHVKGFNFLTDRRGQAGVPGPDFTLGVLRFLVSHTPEMGRYRWAAVTPWPAPFGTQRMFSILAEETDIHVEAFNDFDEARHWLMGAPAGESAEAEAPRPLRPDDDAPQSAASVAPCSYKVSPEEQVVYLTVAEGAAFMAFGDALRSALADPAYRPGFNFLIDCRRMVSLPDPSQQRLAADFFMLLPPADMGDYRWAMVASNSALQGMQSAFGGVLEASWKARARVFMDADEARRWLLSGTAATA